MSLLLPVWPGLGLSQARGLPRAAAVITLADLPHQGQRTYRLILQGGPFPYAKDGTVFGNRERLLPRQRRGYYREYTVETPGARSRAASRIVCGGPPAAPDACWYTGDHYASFRKIVQ
jgi:ribonuclease T1